MTDTEEMKGPMGGNQNIGYGVVAVPLKWRFGSRRISSATTETDGELNKQHGAKEFVSEDAKCGFGVNVVFSRWPDFVRSNFRFNIT